MYIMVHGFSKTPIDSPSRISEVPNSEPLIQVDKVWNYLVNSLLHLFIVIRFPGEH